MWGWLSWGEAHRARASLFVHVKRVYLLAKECFPWAQVHYLMESVYSMDEKDRAVMSEYMETNPYMIDAAGISICRRPRLYWVSCEISELRGVQLVYQAQEQWTSHGRAERAHNG